MPDAGQRECAGRWGRDPHIPQMLACHVVPSTAAWGAVGGDRGRWRRGWSSSNLRHHPRPQVGAGVGGSGVADEGRGTQTEVAPAPACPVRAARGVGGGAQLARGGKGGEHAGRSPQSVLRSHSSKQAGRMTRVRRIPGSAGGPMLLGASVVTPDNDTILFRHAPRREPNSSPRHEGAGPPSTLGGGGVLSKPQMCV